MMLKRFITIGILGLCLMTPVTVKAEESKNMYVTANSGLNIRTEETTDSMIIKALPKGTKVEVVSTDNPEWYKICYEEIEGYMSSQWLSEQSVQAAPTYYIEENNSSEILYGTCSITYYCNCASCCGSYGNATASGAYPTPNHTVAMGGNIPFGTRIRIGEDPTIYTVEDRGGAIGSMNVDVFVGSHSEALSRGRFSAPVYIVK